jgi:hypothetical protein
VQATIKTTKESTNIQFKNFYVISYMNNFDLHHTQIVAVIKGSSLEDIPFSSTQLFATIRNARNNATDEEEDALDFLIHPHYSHFNIIAQEHPQKATLFLVLIILKNNSIQQSLSDIQNFLYLQAQKPVYITINNSRVYQMGKSIHAVTQWHMPNNVLLTQKSLCLTGINVTTTPQQLYQCLDTATKADVDTIHKGTQGKYYFLLKPDTHRTSFATDNIKQYKVPKVLLIIQPHHFGHQSIIYKNFNPFTCSNSHETPIKTSSRSASDWHLAGKKKSSTDRYGKK